MHLELSDFLHKEIPEFDAFLQSRPSTHYKVFKIPKRKIGFRVIAQPTPQVKAVQSQIVSFLEKKSKIHPCSMAYQKGCSIKKNALAHSDCEFILKVDLENFFNSINPEMLFNALESQSIVISDDDKFILEECLFWNRSKKRTSKLILSVGAPSSPYLSNIVMYDFDRVINKICINLNVNYTRYADDLTFSTKEKNVLSEIIPKIREALKTFFTSKIIINESKTIFSSKAHNRHVTGITLTNNNKISVGREKRRYISALIHKFKNSLLDESDIYHLQGLFSFACHIEVDFKKRMKKKYGDDVVHNLIKYSSREN